MYGELHGRPPEDLRGLVDEGLITSRCLLPVRCDWDRPSDDGPPYAGPCGWYYAKLKSDAPPETLRVWRLPNPGEERLYALQRTGNVALLTAEEFADALQRSEPFFVGPVVPPSTEAPIAQPPLLPAIP